MPAIHETAYPRIKPNLNHKELQEIFAPSDQELALLNRKTKKTLPVPRLGFMILLKCYQYLGRPVMVKKIEPYIIKYIANKLNINPETELSGYDESGRKRNI